MKKFFLKYLPVVAALCIATACNKDDDSTNPSNNGGNDYVNTVATGTPFTIKAVSTYSNSLTKIAYSDDITTQTVTMKFTSEDLGIIMIVSDADGSHEAQLELKKVDDKGNGIFDGYWDERGEPTTAGAPLKATIKCNSNSTTKLSTSSITELMQKCPHTYTGTFNFQTETSVSLEDDMAYLEFILASEQKQVYLNSVWYDIDATSHKFWYAVKGGNKVSTRLKGDKTLEAGNIYTISCTDHVDLGQTNEDGKILLWRTSNEGKWQKPSSDMVDVNSTNDRCPTLEEFEQLDELNDEIDVDENNIKGIRFYNDHGSLFLQASGYYYDDGTSLFGTWKEENELGQYWIAPQEDGKKSFMTFRITTSKAKPQSLTKKGRMSMTSYTIYTGAQGSLLTPKTYYTARLVKAL